MKKATTKDELFLIKLFEMTKGDCSISINRYVIGKAIGQNDKGIDTIVQTLTKTNFIKKTEGGGVHLTPHGLKLAEHLASWG